MTDALGENGGIAQYNRDFLSAVAEGGAVSSITVLPRHAPTQITTPARINQSSPRPGRFLYVMKAVLTSLRQPVDIVFCGHLYMAPLAWLIARLKRARLVLQMHGIEAWPRPSFLRRAAVEAADLILCVSRYTRGRVLEWAAIAPERVVVVPVTVADEFTPGDGREFRSLECEGKSVLLTVGRIAASERYKGHDRVIRTLTRLVAGGHDIVYVITGDGDDRMRLEGLARETGVIDRIRFLGAVETQQLYETYRTADLFVMPSTGEGFGIVFLEAMASGTPVLGLNVAGARDALADGELGTALSEEEYLAEAIARLLDAPKPDPDALARAVRARFGRAVFRRQIGMALRKLLQPV